MNQRQAIKIASILLLAVILFSMVAVLLVR
jgi:hypothetical protein